MTSEIVAGWLLTVALHASVLLGIAWLLDRGTLRSRPAWRELMWRAAFFGGFVTASAQILLDAPLPLRIALPVATTTDTTTAPVAASRRDVADNAAVREAASSQNALEAKTHVVALKSSASASSTPARATMFAWRLPSWHLMLIAGWLAGTLLALVRLGGGWLKLESLLRGASSIDNDALKTDAMALAIEAGVAAPKLAAHDELASPIAARGRRILLPRWAVELLDREQLRAMLAHETAHIARRDPSWKFATALWCAVFWFVPFAPLARRRLDEIAELACDAWAALHLGDGRSLAECLAECAERRIAGFDSSLAPAMARRGSPLLQRIDHLIDGVPMNTQVAGVRAGIVAALALAFAAFALPGISLRIASAQPAPPPAPPAAPAPPSPPAPPSTRSEGHHVHISGDVTLGGGKHDLTIVEVNDKVHSYSAKIDGTIEFNDAENDVASLSGGGSASFSETSLGRTQRLEIANRGGKLERRYFLDDVERPVDATAQQWIATIIPTVIRETAIGAEGRVKRLRAKGGADLVIDEIGHIDSGYARGVYLKYLVAGGKLTSAQTTRALQLVDGIDSDYEKRNALAALAEAQPLDAAQQKLVMAQAGKIGSDYERAELLVGMLPQLVRDEDVRAAWLKAADGIGSDYEHRRTLSALLDQGNVDEATLVRVVGAAHSIGSDYERRELLTSAVRLSRNADQIANSYADAASDIGSDYERRESLLALIHAQGFGKVGAHAVLDAASGIGSDFDCREVLVALARVMPNDAELIAHYREVARKLSDSERGEAERALDRLART